MPNLRRHLILIALACAAAFSGCGRPEHAGLAPDVRRELEQGRAAIGAWVEDGRSGVEISDEAVIGLGYAERLRLGLGSPFRLVETALRDPRLPEPARREIAWGLLALLLYGEAYEIDPITLDRAGVAGVSTWPGLGRHHLELIESAITESRDPRAGEQAVRLAYQLAAMEGSLPEQSPLYATRVAALIRDRELARADVARLLRSAEVVHGDPLSAISHWRAERWLRVETPALTALTEEAEREALELAPRLAQTLRMLRPRLGDVRTHRQETPDVNPSYLTPETARRLAEIADSTNMPPQTPIGIASRTYSIELLEQPWLTETERQRREVFAAATDEEQFVAALAQLERLSPVDAAPSLAAVWAAVALRPTAQDPVWFPGFGGPTARELEERYGFAEVRFNDAVPAEWRPFFRGQLERAVQDMQRVLPALDLRGLTVRFSALNRGGTLAMHDPRARELILPPASSAGTVAHEIAHDLDWQVALRRYRVRGDYASDRASRRGTDLLAARVRDLSPSAALDVADGRAAHARRPAENFARAVDWFVAASLASQGRTNGYLSSVQDHVLTGYGTVRPPDISGRGGDAIINILDEVAPLYPATREWFLKTYGSTRAQNSFDLIRGMGDVQLPDPTPAGLLGGAANEDLAEALDALVSARTRGFSAIDEWVCRAPAGAHNAELELLRRRLVADAAAARARGVVLQHATRLHGENGARWVAHQLYGGPWPTVELEEGMEDLLRGLVEEVRRVERIEVRPPGQTFDLLRFPEHCAQRF
ncbi:MAG TPA: hypothetical protein VHG09_08120 [Longimicrobiales bacterium]|nr:hypothetical protein [Longimicrobiales bacterium]